MFFTDMLVCVSCAYGAMNIINKADVKNTLRIYWLLFFAFCAISFFLSALAHELLSVTSVYLSSTSWIFAVAGVMCFTSGIISINIKAKKFSMLLWIYAFINMVLIIMGVDFIWIVIYCLVNMGLVIMFNNKVKLISFRFKHSRGILLGTGFYLLAAFLFVIFRDMKFLDIRLVSHLLIAAGVLVFAKSCEKTIIKLKQEEILFKMPQMEE